MTWKKEPSTRNAVETAIESAKGLKNVRWKTVVLGGCRIATLDYDILNKTSSGGI